MLGDVGHPRERAQPEPLGTGVDRAIAIGQRVQVDEARGREHVELHQVDQGRAAGQVLGRRVD